MITLHRPDGTTLTVLETTDDCHYCGHRIGVHRPDGGCTGCHWRTLNGHAYAEGRTTDCPLRTDIVHLVRDTTPPQE